MMVLRNWVVLVAVLVLAGCSSQQSFPTYFTGSEGIIFSVTSDSLDVVPEQPIPFAMQFHNAGAFDVTDRYVARISLEFDPTLFEEVALASWGYEGDKKLVQLYGKSPYWPGGEQRVDTVSILKAKSLGGRDFAKSQIQVGLCYPYATTLVTSVCVDMDPYNLDSRTQLCEAESLTFSDQGAPVAITRVDVESILVGTDRVDVATHAPSTDEQGNLEIVGTTISEQQSVVSPSVELTIKNVGGGSVQSARDFGVQKLCSFDSAYPLNSAAVRARIGSNELVCFPAVAKFTNDVAQVTCAMKPGDVISAPSNYRTDLQVELAYVYEESKVVEVLIDDSRKSSPALLFTASCSDFNGQFEKCRQYSQMARGLSSIDLDCFYCPSTGKCSSDACSLCGASTVSDEHSRSCLEPCPSTRPKIVDSVSFVGQTSVRVTCSDPAGVTADNHASCGCALFQYSFSSENECGALDNEVVGVWDQGTKAVATIPLSDKPYLCVSGSTLGGIRSETKVFSLR